MFWVATTCAPRSSIDPAQRHVALSIESTSTLEREATQTTIAEYVGRQPEMQVSLGDQLAVGSAVAAPGLG
jgi:hypothetical protein